MPAFCHSLGYNQGRMARDRGFMVNSICMVEIMAHLSENQINSLRALFAPMDAQELDEAMDILIDEVYERTRKCTETNMPDE